MFADLPPVVAVLAVVLLCMQALMSVPQVVKMARAKSAAGVSMTSELVTAVTGTAWMTYAFARGDVGLLLSGLLAVVGYGTTAGLAWRYRRMSARRGVQLVGVWGVVLLVAFVGGGPLLLGTVLTGAAVVQYTPQCVDIWRTESMGGFSPSTGVLRVVYGGLWVVYAVLMADVVLVVWAVATVATFAFTFGVWWFRHRPSACEHAGAAAVACGCAPVGTAA